MFHALPVNAHVPISMFERKILKNCTRVVKDTEVVELGVEGPKCMYLTTLFQAGVFGIKEAADIFINKVLQTNRYS